MVELCCGWHDTWDVLASVRRLPVSRPVNASWDFWVGYGMFATKIWYAHLIEKEWTHGGSTILLRFKMLGHKEPIHSCDMEYLNVAVLKMFSKMIRPLYIRKNPYVPYFNEIRHATEMKYGR
jgi:hypothetical protein